jgi:hypothetical protein
MDNTKLVKELRRKVVDTSNRLAARQVDLVEKLLSETGPGDSAVVGKTVTKRRDMKANLTLCLVVIIGLVYSYEQDVWMYLWQFVL